ncbi:UNVERIFIED_ORG: protein-disulfide isomerase [Pantoea agglomerans]
MYSNKTTFAMLLLSGTVFAASAGEVSAKAGAAESLVPARQVTQVQAVSIPEDAEASGFASGPSAGFTPGQEEKIGEIARDYLLAHPDILLQLSSKLREQQQMKQLSAMTQSVLRHQDVLLHDSSAPSYGPADAKVAFIEFFDYQCSVCARQAPVIESLMKRNPNVRYIFREWPIFAQRWKPSLSAAKVGLQIWKQKGAEAYLAYHNALFATSHNEGQLTLKDITETAAKTGTQDGENVVAMEILSATDALAQNLGLSGTPGMIVMPVSGAREDNVTVIPGGADFDMLQNAIDKANHN